MGRDRFGILAFSSSQYRPFSISISLSRIFSRSFSLADFLLFIVSRSCSLAHFRSLILSRSFSRYVSPPPPPFRPLRRDGTRQIQDSEGLERGRGPLGTASRTGSCRVPVGGARQLIDFVSRNQLCRGKSLGARALSRRLRFRRSVALWPWGGER